MKLRPVSGRAVRDPVKRTLLPDTGAEVTLDSFWRRRLRDGDVEEVTSDTAPKITAASAAKSRNGGTSAAEASADAAPAEAS